MNLNMIVFSYFAGVTVVIGGFLANAFNHHMAKSPIKEEVTHTLMSFGSGVMLSALALVLLPMGRAKLASLPLVFSFLMGSIIFMYLDRYLAQKGGQTATLLAMMMDFVPESIALGAVFAVEPKTATLLAVFMGLQNLPEAFNAFRDLALSGFKPKKILIIFFFLSFFGVLGALFGHFVLSDYQQITAHLMIFASGGILYLLIQDIIPESKLDKNYLTAIGATLGFLVGIIGEKVI